MISDEEKLHIIIGIGGLEVVQDGFMVVPRITARARGKLLKLIHDARVEGASMAAKAINSELGLELTDNGEYYLLRDDTNV